MSAVFSFSNNTQVRVGKAIEKHLNNAYLTTVQSDTIDYHTIVIDALCMKLSLSFSKELEDAVSESMFDKGELHLSLYPKRNLHDLFAQKRGKHRESTPFFLF